MQQINESTLQESSSLMNGSFEAFENDNDNGMELNSIPLSMDMSDDSDDSSSGHMSSGNSPLPKKADFSNKQFFNYENLYTSNIGTPDISANYDTFSSAEKSHMSMKSSFQDTQSSFMNDSKHASGKSINLSILPTELSKSLDKSNTVCANQMKGTRTRSRRDMNEWGKVSVFSYFKDKNGIMLQQPNQTPQPFSYFNKTYPCCKLIGSGHFAATYEVDCNRYGKSAIKKLLIPRNQFYKEKEVFNHEILGKHLNIVEFFLAWVEENTLFIQMELCKFSCNDLKTFFNSCIDNSNPQWVFLADCSRGLQHLHAHNILHLDVKPANILLGSDYYFKLCDFGCSANNAEQFITGEHVDGNFEAPELASRIVSNKADVYALGECVKTLTCENVDNCDADLASVVERMKKCDYMERPNASAICNCKEITVRNIAQFRMDIQATLEPVIEERAKEEQKKKSIEQIPRNSF